jgi:cellulose synthase/poly-beta-1,6-N-acetylglucosamine synthase-like glycosyltransferase
MDDVTICVATFGDDSWKVKAEACGDAAAEQGADVLAYHGLTLASARNAMAGDAGTEFLIFLDADDEIAPGYIDAMLTADGDLRAPRLHLVHPDGSTEIPDLASRDIATMNPCAIGTMIRREMFLDVGGFWEERAWEDWSLFRRCWLTGASIVHVPDAVYVSHVDPAGRNSMVADKRHLHREIIASHNWWLTERRRVTT